jgi:hypothetical protein
MLFTAFPPPPPAPMTLINALFWRSVSRSSISIPPENQNNHILAPFFQRLPKAQSKNQLLKLAATVASRVAAIDTS